MVNEEASNTLSDSNASGDFANGSSSPPAQNDPILYSQGNPSNEETEISESCKTTELGNSDNIVSQQQHKSLHMKDISLSQSLPDEQTHKSNSEPDENLQTSSSENLKDSSNNETSSALKQGIHSDGETLTTTSEDRKQETPKVNRNPEKNLKSAEKDLKLLKDAQESSAEDSEAPLKDSKTPLEESALPGENSALVEENPEPLEKEPEEGEVDLVVEPTDLESFRLVCQTVDDLKELCVQFEGSKGKEGMT